MDLQLVMKYLLPGVSYNSQFARYTETQARKIGFWRDVAAMPTSSQLATAWTTVQADIIANQYKEDRANAHISVEEQLDMIYWDKKNRTELWVKYVDGIKAAYPAPDGEEPGGPEAPK